MTCHYLRIVSDNRADAAVITSEPAPAGTLPLANLKTDVKDEVCRILDSGAVLTLTWASAVQASFAGIPACNLSSDSEIRVIVYADAAKTEVAYDSGWRYAAPGPILKNWDFTQPLNVNNFREGATIVAVWFDDHYMTECVEIHIKDPSREYLDIARVVVGPDFKPRYGASYGAGLGVDDPTQASRAASGALRIDRQANSDFLTLPINYIAPEDRHRFAAIMKSGVGRFHFISVLPEHEDVTLEQDSMIYGVIEADPLAFVTYGQHATQYLCRSW